jgi:hypothetical protein
MAGIGPRLASSLGLITRRPGRALPRPLEAFQFAAEPLEARMLLSVAATNSPVEGGNPSSIVAIQSSVLSTAIDLTESLPPQGTTSAASIPPPDQIAFVRDVWGIDGATDSAIVEAVDSSYSGIPFKEWINFFVKTDEYMQAIRSGDYRRAASIAADYGLDLTIGLFADLVGFAAVPAVARLASWPIQHAINSFHKAVQDSAFQHQVKLYMSARGAGNSRAAIEALEPFGVMNAGSDVNGGVITKTQEGWLKATGFINNGPIGFTPSLLFDQAETQYLAGSMYPDEFNADLREVGERFREFVISNGPAIRTQPRSQTLNEGATATFTVEAASTQPLQYQWRRDGTDLTGATGTSHTTAEPGEYTVRISNSAGSVVSQPATLTVNSGPPRVVRQPQAQRVREGRRATFDVVVSGTTPFSYQWRRNGVVIPGAARSAR